jgi:hypothetical protein
LLTEIILCWEARFKKIMCLSDSLHVVQLVAKEIPRFRHCANLLEPVAELEENVGESRKCAKKNYGGKHIK